MKTIVLLSCVSQKLPHRAPAAELYTSSLFTKALAYARSLQPDAIYVLSALHGLVALDEEFAPYNLTLNTMGVGERRKWAARVLQQLRRVAELQSDRFVFLAGDKYRADLLPHIAHYEIPMQGLSIGRQLQFLSQQAAHHER